MIKIAKKNVNLLKDQKIMRKSNEIFSEACN